MQVAESQSLLLGSEKTKGRTGHFYVSGLQDFSPQERYSCVWVQWVVGYLTDSDLEAFLRRCSLSLEPRGMIIVKDNVSIS